MSLKEYLCGQVGEECGEVTQRANKVNRFGLREVEKSELTNGPGSTNAERMVGEFYDLCAVMLEMYRRGWLKLSWRDFVAHLKATTPKAAKMRKYSIECGTLEPDAEMPFDASTLLVPGEVYTHRDGRRGTFIAAHPNDGAWYIFEALDRRAAGFFACEREDIQ